MKKTNTVNNVCDLLRRMEEHEYSAAETYEKDGNKEAAFEARESARAYARVFWLLKDENYYKAICNLYPVRERKPECEIITGDKNAADDNTDANNLLRCETIEEYMQKVERYLRLRYGKERSRQDFAHLKWTIETKHYFPAWENMLLETSPYDVAKLLHKGGSWAETMNRVNDYIGWTAYTRDL